jgi:hypothetical protein
MGVNTTPALEQPKTNLYKFSAIFEHHGDVLTRLNA